ncbi:MAG: amino acid-binding protein [Desulfovibrio sp.]|nr:amino acid-binding protein [Desulfovibrio sp.]
MSLEQISVFLENKAGRMAEVTGILAGAGVDIKALSLADTSEFGILRLVVDQKEKARESLKARGFTVTRTPVTAVEIKNEPGGLHKVLKILGSGGINVEYMYGFPCPTADAIMIFRFDRTEQAVELLQNHQVRIFSEKDLLLL